MLADGQGVWGWGSSRQLENHVRGTLLHVQQKLTMICQRLLDSCRRKHHKFLHKYLDKKWMVFLNFKLIEEYDIKTHIL